MNTPTMRRKYEAAFILPKGVKRTLGEDGWEFEGTERISPDILDFLINSLNLTLKESYLGMDRYIGEYLQATVVYDDNKKIEHVDFQIYSDTSQQLIKMFLSSNFKEDNELFSPANM